MLYLDGLSLRRKSSTSWFVCEHHYCCLYLTGHGDQRDVSSKNSEGSGGWSHSWDEGTGGRHRVHQAGADSKRAWQSKPFLYDLVGVKWWDTASLKTFLEEGQGDSLSVIPNKTGEVFVLFFLLLSVQLLSSFLPLSPCRFPTALIRVWVAGKARMRGACFSSEFAYQRAPRWRECFTKLQAKLNATLCLALFTSINIFCSPLYFFISSVLKYLINVPFFPQTIIMSDVPVQGRPRQVHLARRVHPHDKRHHHSNSQGSGCRQLCSAGGRDRHCQPEPQSHLWYAGYLQGANPHRPAKNRPHTDNTRLPGNIRAQPAESR